MKGEFKGAGRLRVLAALTAGRPPASRQSGSTDSTHTVYAAAPRCRRMYRKLPIQHERTCALQCREAYRMYFQQDSTLNPRKWTTLLIQCLHVDHPSPLMNQLSDALRLRQIQCIARNSRAFAIHRRFRAIALTTFEITRYEHQIDIYAV